MPIKVKEIGIERLHRLYCEDDLCFDTPKGKIAIIFAQKELLDMLDSRIKRLNDELDKLDFDKIPVRRRERAKVKIQTRIDELRKVRNMITMNATLRKGKGYWWE